MNRVSRLFLVSLSFILLSILLITCNPCDCSWIKPYFNFNIEKLIVKNTFNVADTAKFSFIMNKTFYQYQEFSSFNIIGSASACECLPDGHFGENDSLVNINIWSQPGFNNEYDSNKNINSLFDITIYNAFKDSSYSQLVDFGNLSNFMGFKSDSFRFLEKNDIILKLPHHPKLLNRDYTFLFEFVYKSGRKEIIRSPKIKWEIRNKKNNSP